MSSRAPVALALALSCACSTGRSLPRDDTGLEGLELISVGPTTVVPGSTLVLLGRSFVDSDIGTTRLRLSGDQDGARVDVALPARFVDYDRLEVAWAGGYAHGLASDDGEIQGHAVVEVDSLIDGNTYVSLPLPVTLTVASALEPRLDLLQQGIIFVNDPIVVEGDGFLLGGDEGQTVAVVEGCFQIDGTGPCSPVGPMEVPLEQDPLSPLDRGRATFAFDPRIAGIRPGRFEGTVKLVSRHGEAAGSVERESAHEAATYEVVPPKIFTVSPSSASLGQYVEIRGGGFVGLPPDSPDAVFFVTTVELDGTFTPEGGGGGARVELALVPEFVSGPLLRYVVSEDDELGASVDLREAAGTFRGSIRPIVEAGSDRVVGDETEVTLGIAHVKQVVWLRFLPSYVESLRHFGLRAMEPRIRQRVLDVATRDYAGANVEFRTEPPTDFALYETVDLSGPDPNGLGLFGYDNSPGKDVGNLRLYDKIGGVNATTQEDGYPGYGGVFVESMFGFSEHPGDLTKKIDGADPMFDEIFDPFRPDLGGRPVLAGDIAGGGIPTLTSGDGCPASDRSGQIACAVWVLGSMIGTTMTHEVGHSLGLASQAEKFHNPGDQPNRLMDSGGGRTFYERAELMGEGPAVFCDEDFAYLREILPTGGPEPAVTRPSCY